jgi:sugar (pentulose or hexulose) kinase
MFCRLSEEDHVRSTTTATICSAKDYLFFHLTGELATDPSTATGYGCYDLSARSWHQGIVDVIADLLAVAVPGLPELGPSSMVRPLSPPTALRLGLPSGLPVNLGAADSVVGAAGLGVRGDGEVAYIAGTSSVLLALSSRLVLDRSRRYLVTPMPGDGMWGLEMDLLATGSALAWLARILGSDSVAALGEVARAVEPEDAPVFLPYVGGGEQGALWDPTLRGSLLGLDVHHERSHIARAMLNGIVLESRRCLEVIAEIGLPHSALRFSGPRAAATSFSQDLADASRRRVVVAPGATTGPSTGPSTGSSVLGAALLAARAIAGATVEQAMREGRESEAMVVEPDEARGRVWDHLFAKHEMALAALRPLYHSGVFGEGDIT